MTLSISVSPRRVLRTLIFVIAGLVVASTLAGAALYFLDLGEAGVLWVQLFWIDSETNLPSMYSSATLLATAALLMLIAIATRRSGAPYARHWGVLAVVFTYLGFDEGARIHERTVEPLRTLLGRTSLPSSTFIDAGPAWVVLGGIFVLVFVAAYLRFLRDLPARMRTLLLLAGGLYVGGGAWVRDPVRNARGGARSGERRVCDTRHRRGDAGDAGRRGLHLCAVVPARVAGVAGGGAARRGGEAQKTVWMISAG